MFNSVNALQVFIDEPERRQEVLASPKINPTYVISRINEIKEIARQILLGYQAYCSQESCEMVVVGSAARAFLSRDLPLVPPSDLDIRIKRVSEEFFESFLSRYFNRNYLKFCPSPGLVNYSTWESCSGGRLKVDLQLEGEEYTPSEVNAFEVQAGLRGTDFISVGRDDPNERVIRFSQEDLKRSC